MDYSTGVCDCGFDYCGEGLLTEVSRPFCRFRGGKNEGINGEPERVRNYG